MCNPSTKGKDSVALGNRFPAPQNKQSFVSRLGASAFYLSFSAGFTLWHAVLTPAAMTFHVNIRFGATDITLESFCRSVTFCATRHGHHLLLGVLEPRRCSIIHRTICFEHSMFYSMWSCGSKARKRKAAFAQLARIVELRGHYSNSMLEAFAQLEKLIG